MIQASVARRKILFVTVIFLLTLAAGSFLFEWLLNATSRKFTDELIRAKRSTVLELAIKTFDIPRFYRAKSEYEDLHGLILTLLYLHESPENATWGINSALKLTDIGLNKYPLSSEEYLYLLQKRIGILNRSPMQLRNWDVVNSDVNQLIELSRTNRKRGNEAYAHIERMLLLANRGEDISEGEIDVSYEEALRILNHSSSPNNEINATKFSYYYGYAKCLIGDSNGGTLMLSSLDKVSKKSASFHEAMVANWDWTLVGNLASPKSTGHISCGKYVQEMKKYLRD